MNDLHQIFRIRGAVSLQFFFCGFVFAAWAARIPAFKELFHLDEAGLGATLFMLPLGSFIALPFAGWAVDAFGSRVVLTLSMLFYVILLNLLSFMPSVFHLSVMLFLFGFMGDVVNIAMNTQGLDVQHMSQRPILSSFHAMWSLGALVGALLGGWTIQMGYATGIHFVIVSIPVALLTLLSVPLFIQTDNKNDKGKKRLVLPDKGLWLIGLICLCCTFCEGAMADWSALYYQEVLNNPGKVSTTGFTAYAFAMTIGRFAGDRLILNLKYRLVLLLDGILITTGMLLAVVSQHYVPVLIGFALIGFGVSTVIPISYSVAASSNTMKASSALAAVSTIGFSGFLIGPPVIGFIAQETGLRIALLIVSILGVVIWGLGRKVANT